MKVKLKNVIFTTVFSVAILAACFAASCKKSGYTVSFDTGIVDTEVSSVTRNAYAALGELPQPENEDYTFCGWYFEEDWETEVWEDYAVTEDMTLYAKWTYCGSPKIAAGSGYSLVIDADGNLWAFGRNSSGQLGNGTTEDSATPIQIMVGTKFYCVSAWYHSAAIDIDGNLYVWGKNTCGQVGDGSTEDRLIPYHVMEGAKFKYVECGFHNTYAITEDDVLYAWGRNVSGVLGVVDISENVVSPVKVLLDAKVSKISEADGGCVAVDEEGNIWTWGTNYHGEIGNGTINVNTYTTPQKLALSTTFTSVARLSYTVYAVDIDGNLWAWGNNAKGQLLDGTTEANAIPQKIDGYNIKYLTKSEDGGIAFVDDNNDLWLFGSIYRSNGESEDQTSLYVPAKDFSDKKVYQVATYLSCTMVVSTTGELWVWGKNNHGQLGNGTISSGSRGYFPAAMLSIKVK